MRGPYRKRKIFQPPEIQNFKPAGIPRRQLEKINISVDEYEAFRLADYLGLEHLEASEKMGISRPTFTRLIEKARNRIALAIVDGKELIIAGGNVEFAHTRHRCRDCGEEQVNPATTADPDCPECGSGNMDDISQKFVKSP